MAGVQLRALPPRTSLSTDRPAAMAGSGNGNSLRCRPKPDVCGGNLPRENRTLVFPNRRERLSMLLCISDYLCLCFPPGWPLSTGDHTAVSPVKCREAVLLSAPCTPAHWRWGCEEQSCGEVSWGAGCQGSRCAGHTICVFTSGAEPRSAVCINGAENSTATAVCSWRASAGPAALPPHIPSGCVLFTAAVPRLCPEKRVVWEMLHWQGRGWGGGRMHLKDRGTLDPLLKYSKAQRRL